jgi:hypothetical protein
MDCDKVPPMPCPTGLSGGIATIPSHSLELGGRRTTEHTIRETVVRNCPGDTYPGAVWMHPPVPGLEKLKNGSGCEKILDSIVSTRPGLNTPDVSRCSRT